MAIFCVLLSLALIIRFWSDVYSRSLAQYDCNTESSLARLALLVYLSVKNVGIVSDLLDPS